MGGQKYMRRMKESWKSKVIKAIQDNEIEKTKRKTTSFRVDKRLL